MILAGVRFTRPVQVTGAPRLTIQVGAQARQADHVPTLRAAELLSQGRGFHAPGEGDWVLFNYVVQPSDVDDDGISVPANALTLNGGSIRAVDDNGDAGLSHDGLPDDPTRKVDGSLGDDRAPAISGVFVEPPVNGTFRRGDAITPWLGFSEGGVTVTGAPRIALRIGAKTRFATFRETPDRRTLFFEYIVEESDLDSDGISIAADAVDLNGGTIQDNAGNDADLDLGYFAFNDDPNLKVDGRLTPVPALPLGGILALLLALLGGGWRCLARSASTYWWGGGGVLMAEPEGDDGDVDSGLEQMPPLVSHIFRTTPATIGSQRGPVATFKHVELEHLQHLVKAPAQPHDELQVRQQQVHAHRHPQLRHDGVLRPAHEGRAGAPRGARASPPSSGGRPGIITNP